MDAPVTPGARFTRETEGTELLVVPVSESYEAIAAGRILDALLEATAGAETVSLALAGGSTPRAVHQALVERSTRKGGLDWGRVRFYFGDERAVPLDHVDSNYRMARESLFQPLGISDDCVWAMPAAVRLVRSFCLRCCWCSAEAFSSAFCISTSRVMSIITPSQIQLAQGR